MTIFGDVAAHGRYVVAPDGDQCVNALLADVQGWKMRKEIVACAWLVKLTTPQRMR